MKTSLLCCVVACLLGAGSFNAQTIQIPRHLVKSKGQRTKLNCSPEKGHTLVYWYQQMQNQELKLLIYFQGQRILDQIDMVKERFSAAWPSNLPSSLEIQSSETSDSALYLCASSQSTVAQCSSPLVHKPAMEPAQEAGSFDVKVIQTPRHLINEKGQKAKLCCSSNEGYNAIYWYQ